MGESNMWEKIERFLFDIMGLLLPGIVFLTGITLTTMLLLSPDINKTVCDEIKNLVLIEHLQSMSKELNKHFWLIVVFFLFTSYLIGHAIKVFAKIYYSFFELLFDYLINKVIKFIVILINIVIKYIVRKIKDLLKKLILPARRSRVFNMFSPSFKVKFVNSARDFVNSARDFVNSARRFVNTIVSDIFVFKTQDYEDANEQLFIESKDMINKNFSTNFPEEWFSFYKFSKIIIYHENLKNLNDTFLAKYNLYRSLSFITFLQAALILIIYFNDNLLNEHARVTAIILLIINFIFLYTFHEKYKRYFKFCGNETLVAVYYYLKKNERPPTL
ncbi:hypothetical protein [Peribacillus butanolivorans]|uniref:hypothetical protein n=1 Tax=Peribacillus butanolivorans TaxID=421767 RepID=UPI00380D28CA